MDVKHEFPHPGLADSLAAEKGAIVITAGWTDSS
jgi:hypothetical protein